MRPCERTDSLLSAYLEGETSPAETRYLDSHLASCPRCRTQMATMKALLSRLHSLPRVEVSDGFTERVLARTAGLEPAGVDARPAVVPIASRWSWAVPLAAAAAVLIMVWGVTRMGSHAAPTGPVAQTQTQPETAAPATPSEDVADALPADGGAPAEVTQMGRRGDQGVWLDGDVYVMENYELRQPAGGGTPTLTRASGQAEDKVVVTF